MRFEIEIAVKCQRTVKNLIIKNNYHINKLENSVDQVLQFHSKSFASLLKLTLFLQHLHFEMRFVFTHF